MANNPKIIAVDVDGKASRIKAERLEIEADADDDNAVPMLSLQPGACNLLTVRVDVHHDMSFVEPIDLPAGEHPPVLGLKVQKALDGEDRANAPKKNHIRRWAQAALRADAEVTVRLVGEAEGRALTFAYAEGEDLPGLPEQVDDTPLAGDLVLCVPVVVREAAAQGKTLEAHFAHLVVHGMLHLQGYDHEQEGEASEMEALETAILRGLGYADPYA
jgi:probable rRNA maturation factor